MTGDGARFYVDRVFGHDAFHGAPDHFRRRRHKKSET